MDSLRKSNNNIVSNILPEYLASISYAFQALLAAEKESNETKQPISKTVLEPFYTMFPELAQHSGEKIDNIDASQVIIFLTLAHSRHLFKATKEYINFLDYIPGQIEEGSKEDLKKKEAIKKITLFISQLLFFLEQSIAMVPDQPLQTDFFQKLQAITNAPKDFNSTLKMLKALHIEVRTYHFTKAQLSEHEDSISASADLHRGKISEEEEPEDTISQYFLIKYFEKELQSQFNQVIIAIKTGDEMAFSQQLAILMQLINRRLNIDFQVVNEYQELPECAFKMHEIQLALRQVFILFFNKLNFSECSALAEKLSQPKLSQIFSFPYLFEDAHIQQNTYIVSDDIPDGPEYDKILEEEAYLTLEATGKSYSKKSLFTSGIPMRLAMDFFSEQLNTRIETAAKQEMRQVSQNHRFIPENYQRVQVIQTEPQLPMDRHPRYGNYHFTLNFFSEQYYALSRRDARKAYEKALTLWAEVHLQQQKLQDEANDTSASSQENVYRAAPLNQVASLQETKRSTGNLSNADVLKIHKQLEQFLYLQKIKDSVRLSQNGKRAISMFGKTFTTWGQADGIEKLAIATKNLPRRLADADEGQIKQMFDEVRNILAAKQKPYKGMGLGKRTQALQDEYKEYYNSAPQFSEEIRAELKPKADFLNALKTQVENPQWNQVSLLRTPRTSYLAPKGIKILRQLMKNFIVGHYSFKGKSTNGTSLVYNQHEIETLFQQVQQLLERLYRPEDKSIEGTFYKGQCDLLKHMTKKMPCLSANKSGFYGSNINMINTTTHNTRTIVYCY